MNGANMKTVAVIGGGAAGCIAAVRLSAEKDIKVILFEKQQRILRKVSATGNGRCNLTNTMGSSCNYHGTDAAFAEEALGKYPAEYIISLFRSLGLVTVEEYGGRIYPLSNSANSVVDVLRYYLESGKTEIRTSCEVLGLKKKNGGFSIQTAEKEFFADAVIYACGSAAGEKLGGSMRAYKPLQELGLKLIAPVPSLVQLISDSPYPKTLKGVKAEAVFSVKGSSEAMSSGELLFTDRGISGPAAFDISRPVSAMLHEGNKPVLQVDMAPGIGFSDITDILRARIQNTPELPVSELFTGVVHNRLGRMLVKYAGLDGNAALKSLVRDDIKKAVSALKSFELRITATEGFGNAQVAAGGIATASFNPATMECRAIPGLYVCGEVLDIDGDCGGHNLQWAWASGLAAADSVIAL